MRLIYDEPFDWSPSVERLEPFFREEGWALIERVEANPLVQRYAERRPGLFEVGSNMQFCVLEVDRPV